MSDKISYINYDEIIDDAMHIIVRKALQIASNEGLPGDHHFYISFLTGAPGVEISDRLKNNYPEEMTIVLQYQFDSLIVDKDFFAVELSFDGIKESIKVPFHALSAFADPSVKFGLQFKHFDINDNDEDEQDFQEYEESVKNRNKDTIKFNSDNVISLDKFRKK